MIDSIIFDVDGTFWDSTPYVAEAWNKVLREQTDLPADITPERLKQLFGRTLPEIAAVVFAAYPRETQLTLIDACCEEEHRALLANQVPTYDGLLHTLEVLSEHYPLYVVSNCQAGYIEVFMKATDTEHFFQDHLCPGDTGEAKASNIAAIVRKHKLKAPVYVGDTQGDCNASHEAGVPFVHAGYGFGTADKPEYRIEKPEDLITLFLHD